MSGTAIITREPFGELDGQQVDRYTLVNDAGMSVSILNYGGIIQSLVVPDRLGEPANVVLGFSSLQDYVDLSPYFGAIVGRFANRIDGGTFELDGVRYQVPPNNGPNALHGGPAGFDRRVWAAGIDPAPGSLALTLHLDSPDGDQGFPGNLSASVTYTLTSGANQLSIDYVAVSDAPTVINLSNHSYFNLAGEGNGDIQRHVMRLHASHYLPVNDNLIPTGEIAPVRGTPFDFTEAHIIGERIDTPGDDQLGIAGGYDHCWVLDSPGDPDGTPAWIARVIDPASGRVLDVHTDQPGVQFYTGNFLDGSFVGTGEHVYGHRSGFCLETQHFPDSPNQPAFPSTELRPDQAFRSRTSFSFGVLPSPE